MAQLQDQVKSANEMLEKLVLAQEEAAAAEEDKKQEFEVRSMK